MSSVKLDRRERGCSSRICGAMKVPDPQRWTSTPFLHQARDRLAHRDARNAELLGEIALAGKRGIGLERALADRLLDGLLELEIERRGIAVVQGKEGQRLAGWLGHVCLP